MIRFASENDIDGIKILHEQLHLQHIEYRPDIFAPVEQPVFDNLVSDHMAGEKNYIIVSQNNGTIDGYAAISVCDTEKGRGEILPFTFIEVKELCVMEGREGNGIGTALLDAVKRYGAEIGAKFIELSVMYENTGAQEFYKACGMRVKLLKMQYTIENEGNKEKETKNDSI